MTSLLQTKTRRLKRAGRSASLSQSLTQLQELAAERIFPGYKRRNREDTGRGYRDIDDAQSIVNAETVNKDESPRRFGSTSHRTSSMNPLSTMDAPGSDLPAYAAPAKSSLAGAASAKSSLAGAASAALFGSEASIQSKKVLPLGGRRSKYVKFDSNGRPSPTSPNHVFRGDPGAIGHEISSNVHFQILLYFNTYLYPIWFIGMLIMILWKDFWLDITTFHKFLINIFWCLFVVAEPMRLWLGYSGNLKERVPDLAGCFLFTLFPQIFTCFYYISIQPKLGDGFTLPFEIALNLVYLAMLIPEAFFCYRAGHAIVKSQAAAFFLTLSDQPPEVSNEGETLVEEINKK